MTALSRVLAAPHSVAARVTLARELRETGDSRAKFVEHQLARYRGLGPDNKWRVIDEIAEMLVANAKKWAGPIERLVLAYHFELGLISRVTCTGQTFAEHGDELTAAAPIVGVVLEPPVDLARIAETKAIEQIRSLLVVGGPWLNDEGVARFASSPRVRGLRGVCFADGEISAVGVQALVDSPHLKGVLYIDVTGNPGANVAGLTDVMGRKYIVGTAGDPYLRESNAEATRSYDPGGIHSWPPLDALFSFDSDE